MAETPPTRLDRAGLIALVLLVIGYGVLVEFRSAYMARRHTDLGVYLRAAWAVRSGADPYTVADNNGWHYTYPPLFAILLVPFADAPAGSTQPDWAVPYPVSVALWYLFSVGCLLWSVHRLSSVLEETAPGEERAASPRARRFWWTRAWPVWICLPAAGSTLARGQVNLLLLALLTGFIAAVLRGRRAGAGWWLAAATCLKVIPGLLVLYPLVRRDRRMIGHYALGLVAGLVVVPLGTLGWERTITTAQSFAEGTLLPGVKNDGGRLSQELTDMTSTDNQSIQAMVHNALHPDRAARPPTAAVTTKIAHVLIGLALIGVTFAATRRIPDERDRVLFLLGGLVIVSVAVTPVNHTHYMVLAVPVVLGLVHFELQWRGEFRWGAALTVVVVVHLVSGILPRVPFLPGYETFRDLGFTMLGTLVVWAAGLTIPAAGGGRPQTLRIFEAPRGKPSGLFPHR